MIFQKNFIYKIFYFLYRKLVNRFIFNSIQNSPELNLTHLGSDYGGWTLVDEDYFKNSTIISAGLGEDASFDIEFASKYNAKVIIIDPTPRAIQHFGEIINNLGNRKIKKYNNKSGKQLIETYDLKNIHFNSLVMIKKALWKNIEKIKFFAPPNSKHVSYSITNFQNNYRDDTPFIEVDTTTIAEILSEFKINPDNLPLVKLDIEGAEIEVLNYCMHEGIKPKQILVEFDELNILSKRGVSRVSKINDLLMKNGYRIVFTNGQANFLYIRS